MSEIIQPQWWDEACEQLKQRDRILHRLISEAKGSCLQQTVSPYGTLVRTIIRQQQSPRSAQRTWEEFTQACGVPIPTVESVRRLMSEEDGLASLSRRKQTYVANVTKHVQEHWHTMPDWQSLSDEEVIKQLCKISGVGRWTAELFLIFYLRRPNILPLDDTNLHQAISLHYFSGEPVSRFEIREVAQAWTPWRTAAVWHLWHSLDATVLLY